MITTNGLFTLSLPTFHCFESLSQSWFRSFIFSRILESCCNFMKKFRKLATIDNRWRWNTATLWQKSTTLKRKKADLTNSNLAETATSATVNSRIGQKWLLWYFNLILWGDLTRFASVFTDFGSIFGGRKKTQLCCVDSLKLNGCALSAEGLKYFTRPSSNYTSSLRWTLWCSKLNFFEPHWWVL